MQPTEPTNLSTTTNRRDQNFAPDPSSNSRNFSKPFPVGGGSQPSSKEGFANIRNQETTTVDTERKPAVVHETVQPNIQHIREEKIVREHHTHSIHHRILPVVDVQVLPTKHYVPAPSGSDGFVEVPAESIPGRATDAHNNQNWVVAETVSRSRMPEPLTEAQLQEPARFTARKFEGAEGDYKEWVDANGVKKSETTWIHPPRLAQAPIEMNTTAPLSTNQPSSSTQTQMQTSPSRLADVTNSRPPASIAAASALNSAGSHEPTATDASTSGAIENTLGQSNAGAAARVAASKLASR